MARSSQPRGSAVTRALAILLCALVKVDSFAAAETVNIGGKAGWTRMRYGNMDLRRGDTLGKSVCQLLGQKTLPYGYVDVTSGPKVLLPVAPSF